MTTPNVLRPAPGGLFWNPALARYVNAAGRIVSAHDVRAAIDLTIESYKPRARVLAEQLRAGTLSLRMWELEMEVVVKDANLLGAAAATGGWEQLRANSSALGRAGREIRTQYEFLDGFVRDIASGKQKLDGTLANRAVMYVEAARGTYEAQREVEDAAAGYDEERSIRHASDSCPGCIREAKRGWVALGALVPINERDCLTRCKCEIERRRSAASERRRRAQPSQPRRAPRTSRQRRETLIGV